MLSVQQLSEKPTSASSLYEYQISVSISIKTVMSLFRPLQNVLPLSTYTINIRLSRIAAMWLANGDPWAQNLVW